jgi:hypothetical protein
MWELDREISKNLNLFDWKNGDNKYRNSSVKKSQEEEQTGGDSMRTLVKYVEHLYCVKRECCF